MGIKKFFLVDTARQRAAENMERYIAALKELVLSQLFFCPACDEGKDAKAAWEEQLSALHAIAADSGCAEELAAAARGRLLQAFEAVSIQSKSGNQDMIGCQMRGQFTWASWNGFSSPCDVKAHIEKDPSLRIADESGQMISWDQFLRNANGSNGGGDPS